MKEKDSFDIICDLLDEAHELQTKASDELKILGNISAKYNIPNIIIDTVRSDNMERVQELIEYFRSIKFIPYQMLFLFQKQYEVKGGAKLKPNKKYKIDYSTLTKEAIAEIIKQKKKTDKAFNIHGKANDIARQKHAEYKMNEK